MYKYICTYTYVHVYIYINEHLGYFLGVKSVLHEYILEWHENIFKCFSISTHKDFGSQYFKNQVVDLEEISKFINCGMSAVLL